MMQAASIESREMAIRERSKRLEGLQIRPNSALDAERVAILPTSEFIAFPLGIPDSNATGPL